MFLCSIPLYICCFSLCLASSVKGSSQNSQVSNLPHPKIETHRVSFGQFLKNHYDLRVKYINCFHLSNKFTSRVRDQFYLNYMQRACQGMNPQRNTRMPCAEEWRHLLDKNTGCSSEYSFRACVPEHPSLPGAAWK